MYQHREYAWIVGDETAATMECSRCSEKMTCSMNREHMEEQGETFIRIHSQCKEHRDA